ncbi:MAG TPA: glycosyltransferase family 2 protein [Candidatus Eisenbergiella stercoravium]|nr:glycosyltransferase family 2 protein [Candidatus Eisenbergiella stercoravium]
MEEQKILLIIPAYNEADNIGRVVENLIQNFPQYDYVVVNDGSSDGTGELCMEKGYQVLNLPINLGIGGAVQTGYRYALKYGYDIAVQLDGDGQHDAAYVKKLIEPLLRGEADVVVGSRFLRREGFQSSRSRRAGINILSDLIWLCTGKRIRDVTSGFRAVNRRFISIYAEDYPSDYPEPEAIITAVMHRGRVAEVPVVMKEREGGTSSITFRKSVYYMIKVTLAILVKRISYGIRR